jgi:hypothetical protein
LKTQVSREKAIDALLQCPTIRQAALMAGISDKTLGRWLKDPEFQKEYRLARQESFTSGAGMLARAMGAAVLVLRKHMTGDNVALAIRAATAIIDKALHAEGVLNHEERLAALEALAAEQQRRAP